MQMTSKAQKIQNELNRLDKEIKIMRQNQKNQREMMYAELGKEFYKASGAKSYAEAFAKIGIASDTSLGVSQSNNLMDEQDIQFLMNIVHHMTKGDNGNWRLPREELQTLVNRVHDMFDDSSKSELTPDEMISADVSFLR